MADNGESSKGHTLLPCPFCGSKKLDTQTFSYVICDKCGAFGPSPGNGRSGVELWNQRREVQRAVDHARDVLAQPEPASAADGEVADLVTWLRREACFDSQWAASAWAPRLNRAAELLERQALRPIPVSERLPESSVKVLAHYFNDLGKGQTICAIWVPAKTRSDSYGDDDFTEYDEASDTFYWPEGWYEAIENWDDLGYIKVDEGEVLYWQPLPKWPAHALPLPEVE